MTERKLIGRVGVDSGQLMIGDPCYIDSNWVSKEEGKVYALKFWGGAQEEVARHIENEGFYDFTQEKHLVGNAYVIPCDDEKEYNRISKEIHEMIETFNIDGIVMTQPLTTATYSQICQATLTEQRFGSLRSPNLVAFGSGYGDGLYNVYGTFDGNIITKVEIELIEEES